MLFKKFRQSKHSTIFVTFDAPCYLVGYFSLQICFSGVGYFATTAMLGGPCGFTPMEADGNWRGWDWNCRTGQRWSDFMWIILVSRNVSIVTLLWRNSNVPVKSMQVKKYKHQFEMYVNKPTLNELRKNRSKPTDLPSLTHLAWDSRIFDESHALTPHSGNLTHFPAQRKTIFLVSQVFPFCCEKWEFSLQCYFYWHLAC